MRAAGGLEALSEARAERAAVEGAADLEQPVGTAPGLAHLLGFVHPAVHQEGAVHSLSAVPTRIPARCSSASSPLRTEVESKVGVIALAGLAGWTAGGIDSG